MVKFEVGENRDKLGFKDEVFRHFKFLIDNYGFNCVEMNITFVRYESKKVFANIYHSRGSYELGFEIGFISNERENENKYSLKEIIELLTNDTFTPFQTSNVEGVKKFVSIMADLVKKYAIDAILGDKNFFKKLAEARAKWFNQYMANMKLDNIRPKAGIAWKEKNYKGFVELYSTIPKEYLTRSEEKKIEYARNHMF